MVSEMNPINISSAAATERHRKSVPHYDVSPALSDLPNISFIACLHQKESHCGPVILAGLKLTVFHPPQGREERFPIGLSQILHTRNPSANAQCKIQLQPRTKTS
jgi:hypothetical protein